MVGREEVKEEEDERHLLSSSSSSHPTQGQLYTRIEAPFLLPILLLNRLRRQTCVMATAQPTQLIQT